MKTHIFFTLVGIFLVSIIAPPTNASRLDQQYADGYSNYVVIGAFAVHSNAVNYAAQATAQGFQATVDINPARKLYYVYVLSTADHEQALQEATRLRKVSAYTEAWVFYGPLGEQKTEPVADVNPVTEQTIEVVKTAEEPPPAHEAQPVTTTDTAEATVKMIIPEGNGKPFYFKIFRAVDGKEMDGKVEVVDPERVRKVGTYKGNEPVRVAFTGNKSGNVSIICQSFGYRKAQREINYNNPTADDITTEQDVTIIPFDLVRLQKGDIAVMYNVFFFKDAAIMRPESAYEVNSLIEFMKEQPTYRIKIHGHTNGNASGRIIGIGANKNFFSLEGSEDGFGTAKNLSEDRADVIRQYLISKGIEEHRMEVKAWGGKKALYDKHSNRAQENVRVEIEILQD